MAASPLTHIKLLNDTGILEELEAVALGGDQYRLDFSPGAVMGLAAGDVVTVGPDGTWELLESGGNVSVQFFVEDPVVDEIQKCESALRSVDGVVDNRRARVFVATVPRRRGYRAIMAALHEFFVVCPHVYWQFGNVETEDSLPLPGWEDFKQT